MTLFEYLSMAFSSIRANKMRSLLTMLGIIIGIAAVIAIETVGGSLSGSVSDSMSGMGVNSITVTLTQKDSDTATAGGGRTRLFMNSTPDEDDLITQGMVDEYLQAFPDRVDHVELSRTVGQGTIEKAGDPQTTITANVSGANHDALAAKEEDTPILSGRWLDDERDAGRRVCVVSEKFVEQAVGGSVRDAVGQRITLTINRMPYDFYITGVYHRCLCLCGGQLFYLHGRIR